MGICDSGNSEFGCKLVHMGDNFHRSTASKEVDLKQLLLVMNRTQYSYTRFVLGTTGFSPHVTSVNITDNWKKSNYKLRYEDKIDATSKVF